MKSINHSIYLIIIVVLATMLFQQCKQTVETTSDISYNRDSAALHHISEQDAIKLTSSYRTGLAELAGQLRNPAYLSTNFNLPYAEKFNRDGIAVLLNQPGAKGIRVYLARDYRGRNNLIRNTDTLRVKLVLVAVDSKGHDLVSRVSKLGSSGSAKVSYVVLYDNTIGGDQISENGQLCPNICDPNSPLNHQ